MKVRLPKTPEDPGSSGTSKSPQAICKTRRSFSQEPSEITKRLDLRGTARQKPRCCRRRLWLAYHSRSHETTNPKKNQ